MYRRHMTNHDELVLWLSFTTTLLDTIVEKYPSGRDRVGIKGITTNTKLLGARKPQRDDNVDMFATELEKLSNEIYIKMLKNVYERLRPLVSVSLLTTKEYAAKPQKKRTKKPQDVTQVLTECLKSFLNHNLFESIIKQFHHQIFYYVDCILFNQVIDHGDRYCFGNNGFEIKLAISYLEDWANRNLQASISDQLYHLSQAANIIILDKTLFSDKDVVASIFPSLNWKQIGCILSSFQPDKTSPGEVPKSVMKFVEAHAAKDQRPLKLDESVIV